MVIDATNYSTLSVLASATAEQSHGTWGYESIFEFEITDESGTVLTKKTILYQWGTVEQQNFNLDISSYNQNVKIYFRLYLVSDMNMSGNIYKISFSP